MPFSSPGHDLPSICRHWLGAADVSLRPLAGAGFSGSPLFVVECRRGRFVLKAFAPGTPATRIHFVHALMRHLASRGIGAVPAVVASASGDSFWVDARGRAWELQAFMPGSAVFTPADGQITAAMALLGRLHDAAASLPENPPDAGPSPALTRRVDQARAWLARPWENLPTEQAADGLRRAIVPRLTAAIDGMRHADGAALITRLAASPPRSLRRQSVLRDVWAAHVLFASDDPCRVSGLVDFHAATTDTPAADLGRLLGSWLVPAAAEPRWWRDRLAAYGATHADDLDLVPFLAASGVVFGLDNWFRWVLVEGRTFADAAAVTDRVDWLLGVLSTALQILADGRFRPRFDR